MFRYFIVVFQFVQIAIELNGNLKYIEDKRQIFYWLESFFSVLRVIPFASHYSVIFFLSSCLLW